MPTYTTKFQPASNWLLIKPIFEVGSNIVGGIILPDNAVRSVFLKGNVVAVGPEVKAFSVGDNITTGIHIGVEMPLDGTKYRLIRDNEIFGRNL